MTWGESQTSNPWLEGLAPLMDVGVVRERAFLGGSPISFSAEQPLEQRIRLLDRALKQIYVPTESGCQLITMLVGCLYAVLSERYRDIDSYKSEIYEVIKESEDEDETFICITGLAGVGKTSLMEAFERVLPAPRVVHLRDGLPDAQINLIRRLKIKSKLSDSQVYLALANPVFAKGKTTLGQANAHKHLVPWFYNSGVGMLVIDELQFINQSSTANTRVTKLLMDLGNLGVPLTYVINYSLAHRLNSRLHEEQDRLLSDHHVLEPVLPDAASWRSLISEYVNVLPDTFHLDPSMCATELHRLTAGLPRILRQLLVAAYRYFAKVYKGSVTIDTVREAYRSQHFSTQRANIEAIASLSVSNSYKRTRKDLVCPFDGNESASKSENKVTGLVDEASSVENPYGEIVPPAAQHQLESTLTPEDRHTLKKLRKSGKTASTKAKTGGSVLPISGKKQTELNDLYRGLDAFRDEISSKGEKHGH